MTTKAYRGLPMEGPIAGWYARSTRTDAEHVRAAEVVAAVAPPGAQILEVAPGPGYLAIELARRGYEVTGVDISGSFVRIASENAARAGVKARFLRGSASDLPLEAGSCDFVVCKAAFKNFMEPEEALAEFHRVLRPGGQALILDLRKDSSDAEVDAHIHTLDVGPFGAWMTRWIFRNMLIPRAYSGQDFLRFAAESPFGAARLEKVGLALQVWLTKSSA